MHRERTVLELNEVVFMQQQTIDRLEKDLSVLREQMLAVEPSLVKNQEDEEPPPHF
jgi:SlyX protein